MNTPAHMALGLAVLGRRPRRVEWGAILIGAFLPDAALFAEALLGRGATGILVPALESIPVWAAALCAALLTRQRKFALLSAAALFHIGMDLPLHATDARPHFWPLTDWRWSSPLSIWDVHRHGRIIGVLEGVLFLGCLVVIWRRLRTFLERLLALIFLGVYIAAFVHFAGHAWFGQHWAVW